MMMIKCSITKEITERPVLSIPSSYSGELRGFAGKNIILQLGLSKYEVQISTVILSEDTTELVFPENHSSRLSGKFNLSSYFSPSEETLYLGPVIAIITDMSASGKPVIGRLEKYYDELCYLTKDQGGLFYLTGCSLLNDQKGLFFDEKTERWVEQIVPLPDLLYNRIHSRKTDRSEAAKQLQQKLEEKSVFTFNTSYLTKEYVHQFLSQEHHLIEYLPNTETFSYSGLRSMLSKHSDVFIKHIAGSQGKKLLRLSYLENTYLLKQNLGSDSKEISFATYEETVDELNRLKVSSHFIIQETIPLIEAEGRSLDFRFLCHLTDPQQWQLISATARVSGEGQFVSNVAQGGELVKPKAILSEFFGKRDALRIFRVMEELALSACTCLAERCPLNLGELGVDIGIDETGKPWLIEINSKPSKQTYFENNKIRPSVKTLYHLSKSIWEERRHHHD
ncbi:YheC/YheD family endospore coat-associated protein [Bacillus sp. AK031]